MTLRSYRSSATRSLARGGFSAEEFYRHLPCRDCRALRSQAHWRRTIPTDALRSVDDRPHLIPNLPFDVQRDFAPITTLTASAYVLAIHLSLGVTTLPALVQRAKAEPGKLNYV